MQPDLVFTVTLISKPKSVHTGDTDLQYPESQSFCWLVKPLTGVDCVINGN